MMGLTFVLLKKIHLYRDEQSAGHWQNRGKVKSIQGAVVLVIKGEYEKYASKKYQNNNEIQPSLLYKDFEEI
jgi:hypothetical protein